MRIRPITSTDSDFAAWHDVYLRAHHADYPTGPRYLATELRVLYEGSEQHDVRLWLAEEDGHAVGAAFLGLPLRDNRTLAEPDVWVLPEARRRGVGTALLAELTEAARVHGRSSMLSYLEGPADADATGGTRFAEKHGFTRRITEIARAQRPPLDVVGVDDAERAALPHAADYRVRVWKGPVPAELVTEYARLEGRLSTDAPLGELDYEAEVWDEARIRRSEERQARMGRETFSAVAVAADETLAAMTRISVQRVPEGSGFQDTTIVDPAHRGHRLGMLVKAANARQVFGDWPDVRAIWTWNADSNALMIGINESLGYRVEGWSAGYQRSI